MALTIASANAFSVSYAQSDEYRCYAKANPARGFHFDIDILMSSPSKGGVIRMAFNRNRLLLASISDTATYYRFDMAHRAIFQFLLEQIKDEDVSGVNQQSLAAVNTIEILKSRNPYGEEIAVFRLFADKQQVGGTVMISGRATACLP